MISQKLSWPTGMDIIRLLLGIDAGLWFAPSVVQIPISSDATLFMLAFVISLIAAGSGLGGAVLMVPVLLLFHDLHIITVPTATAGALASLSACIAAFIGSIAHRRAGTINRRLALAMGIAGAVVALILACWSYRWGIHNLTLIDSIVALLAVLGLWMHRDTWKRPHILSQRRIMGLIAITALVGISSGVTGMPGSFLLIPATLWMTPLPYRTAVGTVLNAVCLIALVSLLIKLTQGLLTWPLAIPVMGGSIPGALWGAELSIHASAKALRLLASLAILTGSLTALLHPL